MDGWFKISAESNFDKIGELIFASETMTIQLASHSATMALTASTNPAN